MLELIHVQHERELAQKQQQQKKKKKKKVAVKRHHLHFSRVIHDDAHVQHHFVQVFPQP